MAGSDPGADPFLRDVHEAVAREKLNKGRRHDYMTLQMIERENLLGGREEGRAEGREEGREEGLVESIHSLMETLRLSASQAMDALRVPEEERRKLASLL